MSQCPSDTFAVAMNALNGVLAEASERAAEARGYTFQHERNAAIGTLIGLDDILTDALALYRVAVFLHRRSGP